VSLLQKLDQVVARHAELQAALSAPASTRRGSSRRRRICRPRPAGRGGQGVAQGRAELRDAERWRPIRHEGDRRRGGCRPQEAPPELEQTVRRCCCQGAADEKNAILEIRAGTRRGGGAVRGRPLPHVPALCRRAPWKFEIIELSDTGIGGYKEAIATVSGRGVFARLKFESGVHRVQRVPATEASGRIHTRRRPSRCCRKPRNSTSRSTRRTCASTSSAPRDGRPVGQHH